MAALFSVADPAVRARALEAHDRLCREYGCPVAFFHELDPLSELVSSLLSPAAKAAVAMPKAKPAASVTLHRRWKGEVIGGSVLRRCSWADWQVFLQVRAAPQQGWGDGAGSDDAQLAPFCLRGGSGLSPRRLLILRI